MSQEKTVLLVGGSDSGKTNYMGRIWLAINDNLGGLEVDGTPNDLEYLNDIANHYYKGQFAPHTAHEVRNKVTIPVKTPPGTPLFSQSKLIIPDVSGEEWTNIYKKRGWTEEWESTMSTVTGCLVFVRVDSDLNISPIDWIKWSQLFEDNMQEEIEIPTQVILIDWLQCLFSVFAEKGNDFLPRIGIIITAYDLIPEDQKALGPDTYLKENFPLFWQFIHANNDKLNIRIFGTSIASGDFNKDPEFRNKFLENPKEAGFVVSQSGDAVIIDKNITLPIIWAMGL